MSRRIVLDEDIATSLVTACLVVSGDVGTSEVAAIHPAHWRWIANMLGDALDALPIPSTEATRRASSSGLSIALPPPEG